MMRAFGRIAWIGQAWVTALMTLVTAVPHFDCRCPDGHVKPFCLSIARDASGCCCGGTCCSSTEGGTRCCGAHKQASSGQAQVTSCCNHQDRKTSSSTDHCQVVSHSGCTKTLAQPQVVTISNGTTAVAKAVTFPAFLSPQPAPLLSLPTMAHGYRGWEEHLLPPPTDLLTLLRRLII
jgi:hypothetical protein